MYIRSRVATLLEVARIAAKLVDYHAAKYSRFLFEVNYGLDVPSLAIIEVQQLRNLLNEEAPFSRINEIFPDTQLLWHDESNFRLILTIDEGDARTRLAKVLPKIKFLSTSSFPLELQKDFDWVRSTMQRGIGVTAPGWPPPDKLTGITNATASDL